MRVTLRDNIIDLLKTIAQPSEQRDYEEKVPIANVPAELICMWFHDLYHPEDELFWSSFSKSERDALVTFHQFYDERVDHLPTDGGVDTLQRSPEWQEIQEQAQAILVALGWSQDAA